MKLSVIIPTYKRDRLVLETLKELELQNFSEYEIIVVSQSPVSVDLKRYQKSNSRVKIYEQLNRRGAVFNRNLGVQKSSGEIILFLDDDIKPLAKDFFQNHLNNFNNPCVVAVAGRAVEDPVKNKKVFSKVGYVTKTGEFIMNLDSKVRQNVMTGGSGNLSVRRESLLKVGCFDENFQIGMREDSDLFFRLGRLGEIVFDPFAGIYHLNANYGGMELRIQRSSEDRINWYKNFFHNEVLFFLKHRNHLLLPIFIFYHKLRPILSCTFWYGRGRPRAIIMPWIGMLAGYRTYRMEIKSKSKWL